MFLQSTLIHKSQPTSEGRTLGSLETAYDLALPVTGLYELPKNSVDAVFVGSSLIYCGVNPSIIWQECGYSSYDICASAMQLDTMCYVIEEALREQSPSVMVVEATFLDAERYDARDANAYYTTSSPLTAAKLSFALASSNEDEAAAIIVPLTKYHVRWADVDGSDVRYLFSDKSDPLLGFVGLRYPNKTSYTEFSGLSTGPETSGEVADSTKAYIDEMKRLCDEGDAKLVFVQVPSVVGLRDDRYPYTNVLEEYLKSEGIDFIDCNDRVNELGFEPGDIAGDTHLTVSGAKRFSPIIGNDIARLCGLTGEKGRAHESYFNACAESYEKLVAEATGEN